MSEKSNWVLIATTVITVAGTIAVAVINQQGKTAKADAEQTRIEREKTPVGPDKPPADTGTTPPVVPDNKSVPDNKTERRQSANADTDDDASAVVSRNPLGDGPRVSALLGIVDVSGPWHDAGHQSYMIEQNGAAIRLTGPLFPVGMVGSVGNGGVRWQFTDAMGAPGVCSGPLNGTRLEISCMSPSGMTGLQFHRPNT